MGVKTTVLVEDVSEKSGTSSNGRTWKKWALKDSDGQWYGTFESGVVVPAMKGQTYEIEWEQDGNFKNLLRAAPAGPQAPASATAEGNPDWDLIGLRKTRCALWCAILPDTIALAYSAWSSVQTDAPGRVGIQNFFTSTARDLIVAAEVDIFHRDPATDTEDVPF